MRFLRCPSATRDFGSRDREFENGPASSVACHASAAVDGGDDGAPHILIRLKEAVVDPQLPTAGAHDYSSIGCQPHAIRRPEPEALEPRAQFSCVGGWLLGQ